jgi:hypothetical protein
MLITYVTNCVEQNSDRPSAGQEMPCGLWSVKVNCCVHKSMPEREGKEREVESFVAI